MICRINGMKNVQIMSRGGKGHGIQCKYIAGHDYRKRKWRPKKRHVKDKC